jgi:hypothetical protein
MDAHEKNRTWAARVAFGALVVLLAVGLWQGYGTWLLGAVRAHGS